MTVSLFQAKELKAARAGGEASARLGSAEGGESRLNDSGGPAP